MSQTRLKMRPVTNSNMRRSYNRALDEGNTNPYSSMYQTAFGHDKEQSIQSKFEQLESKFRTKGEKQSKKDLRMQSETK